MRLGRGGACGEVDWMREGRMSRWSRTVTVLSHAHRCLEDFQSSCQAVRALGRQVVGRLGLGCRLAGWDSCRLM